MCGWGDGGAFQLWGEAPASASARAGRLGGCVKQVVWGLKEALLAAWSSPHVKTAPRTDGGSSWQREALAGPPCPHAARAAQSSAQR